MRVPLFAAAAVVGIAAIAAAPSASAAPLAGAARNLAQQTQAGAPTVLQDVQWRGRRGGRVGRRGGRRGGGGHNAGAAAAGAAIGLFLGAVIADQAARHQQAVEWCMRRYRSYDPRTETWVDYHGRVHHCP